MTLPVIDIMQLPVVPASQGHLAVISGAAYAHTSALAATAAVPQGDFVVAFLDIVGPDLCKTVDTTGKADVTPQLNHLLRQALLSCSGGVRLDEEVNGPMELLRIETSKGSGDWHQRAVSILAAARALCCWATRCRRSVMCCGTHCLADMHECKWSFGI